MADEPVLGDEQEQRLGLTFHRTFSLLRPALVQVLDLSSRTTASDSKCLDRDAIRELTHLGTIYVESVPRYGFGAGLLDNGYCLTTFGMFAQTYDRYLEQLGTQWLMHYHLSAPQGPGPAFWHDLVSTRFQTGSVFTRDELAAQIRDLFLRTERKALAARSAQATATIFLGTYTKDEALGRLGLIEELGDNRYRIGNPEPPPPWAIGYALLDFWRGNFGSDRLGINLDTLSEPGGFAGLFVMGAGRLNMLLHTLFEIDYVDIHRVAPPYQLVLLRQDPEPLLQRLYGTYNPD